MINWELFPDASSTHFSDIAKDPAWRKRWDLAMMRARFLKGEEDTYRHMKTCYEAIARHEAGIASVAATLGPYSGRKAVTRG